ncbi:MAG: Trk family potassium uptake protein [Epulopiscium sp.]|mgnify:CR=1 FL=1|nr:Trk family potassium uptake protein [Candidatus Epulonipiscium sp.]
MIKRLEQTKKKKNPHKIFGFYPTQILVLGFFAVILLGAILLNLPMASQNNEKIGFINALFTATSAVCVTGLVVVNTLEHWTLFGKTVIIVLIQIGGLGFMTLATSLFIIMGKKITLRGRLVMQEALNQNSLSGIVRLTKSIIIGTLMVEGIAAFFLSLRFIPLYIEEGIGWGIYLSIFHAVSAFCNAGFDLIGPDSLVPFQGDLLINVVIMGLIVLGGLGFTVWLDLLRTTKHEIENQFTWKHWFQKLTLHTKLVLVLTLALVVLGFAFFAVAEWSNPLTLQHTGFKNQILGALFQSVSPRTAGFNTISLAKMKDASKFMMIILMFIGGSPAGTAGGVKTVTFGILVLTVLSVVKGKPRTEVFHRTIPSDIIQKALAVMMISLGVVVSVTMLLTITEEVNFLDALFEATSAFGTVGSTLGITPNLSNLGKIIISVTMFIGRLGPVTMALAFSLKQDRHIGDIKSPEERVLVG